MNRMGTRLRTWSASSAVTSRRAWVRRSQAIAFANLGVGESRIRRAPPILHVRRSCGGPLAVIPNNTGAAAHGLDCPVVGWSQRTGGT